MQNVEDRLGSLEAQNRWLRRGIGSILCLLLVILSMGAADKKKKAAVEEAEAQDEVRAKRLVIVDDDGNERIILEVAEKKFNNDKTEKRKAVFATISIVTPEGTECASLDATDIGYTRLKLFNEEGKKRIEAVTSPNPTGFAKLFFYDNDGKEVEKKFP